MKGDRVLAQGHDSYVLRLTVTSGFGCAGCYAGGRSRSFRQMG